VQTLAAGAKLPGDARSGWRVLRALGAQLGLDGFTFTELGELRAELQGALAAKFNLPKNPRVAAAPSAHSGLVRVATVPLYRSDAVVRRSPALQAHPLTGKAAVGLNPEDAMALGLANDASASVKGGAAEVVLPVVITRAVPRGAAWIESTWPETRALPPTGAALTVARA
jgi:NADH-quinone oxidoreductase subunit G